MPRALTTDEKRRQSQKLLEKGKTMAMAQGIKRVSVDEVAKAAGMAKGSFYQHFESKERFLAEVVWLAHLDLFAEAERVIATAPDIETAVRAALARLFAMPETIFFLRDFEDIEDIFAAMPSEAGQAYTRLEGDAYGRMLQLAGIDTTIVDPGVVHNFVHLLAFLSSAPMMIRDAVPQTTDTMTDALVAYILRGAK